MTRVEKTGRSSRYIASRSSATLTQTRSAGSRRGSQRWRSRFTSISRKRFVEALFTKWDKFQQPPRHPKWRDVNLAATVPGWKRFPAAEDWLRENHVSQAVPAARKKFQQFLATTGRADEAAGSASDHERLFQEFIKWNRQQEGPQ